MEQTMEQDEFTGLDKELWAIAEKMCAEYKGNNGRNRHQKGRKSTLSDWRVVLVAGDDDTDKA